MSRYLIGVECRNPDFDTTVSNYQKPSRNLQFVSVREPFIDKENSQLIVYDKTGEGYTMINLYDIYTITVLPQKSTDRV